MYNRSVYSNVSKIKLFLKSYQGKTMIPNGRTNQHIKTLIRYATEKEEVKEHMLKTLGRHTVEQIILSLEQALLGEKIVDPFVKPDPKPRRKRVPNRKQFYNERGERIKYFAIRDGNIYGPYTTREHALKVALKDKLPASRKLMSGKESINTINLPNDGGLRNLPERMAGEYMNNKKLAAAQLAYLNPKSS